MMTIYTFTVNAPLSQSSIESLVGAKISAEDYKEVAQQIGELEIEKILFSTESDELAQLVVNTVGDELEAISYARLVLLELALHQERSGASQELTAAIDGLLIELPTLYNAAIVERAEVQFRTVKSED